MNASQRKALSEHRRRLAERGMSRYEVRGLERDKELVRSVAKQLAKNDSRSTSLRQALTQQVASDEPRRFKTGGDIWAALRRSPLVGVELNLERDIAPLRDLDL